MEGAEGALMEGVLCSLWESCREPGYPLLTTHPPPAVSTHIVWAGELDTYIACPRMLLSGTSLVYCTAG